MVDKDKRLVAVENQSRRSFLGAGSAVLAAATLVGLTANAQQREDTRKAEADHSSSDPAQENKPLLAENPNPIHLRPLTTVMWGPSGFPLTWYTNAWRR